MAIDCKLNLDDNALFRHPDLAALRDLHEEDPLEVEAGQFQPQLCKARRQCRVHGQRRGTSYGNDGHH